MFYPESEAIASKYAQHAENIRKLDNYLAARNGEAFYANQVVSPLGIKLAQVQSLLELFANEGVVTKQPIWLCPVDGKELQFGAEARIQCFSCGGTYGPEDCERQTLYEPKVSALSATARLSAEKRVRLERRVLLAVLIVGGVAGLIQIDDLWVRLGLGALSAVATVTGAIDLVYDESPLKKWFKQREKGLTEAALIKLSGKQARKRKIKFWSRRVETK